MKIGQEMFLLSSLYNFSFERQKIHWPQKHHCPCLAYLYGSFCKCIQYACFVSSSYPSTRCHFTFHSAVATWQSHGLKGRSPKMGNLPTWTFTLRAYMSKKNEKNVEGTGKAPVAAYLSKIKFQTAANFLPRSEAWNHPPREHIRVFEMVVQSRDKWISNSKNSLHILLVDKSKAWVVASIFKHEKENKIIGNPWTNLEFALFIHQNHFNVIRNTL